MSRVAFLTCAALADGHFDDLPVVAEAAEMGVVVDFVDWRAEVDWTTWDAVVIRTPWDYQHDLPGFLGVLRRIEASGTPLYNDSAVVEWNADKGYLLELEARGIPVIPTRLGRLTVAADLERLADGWAEVVAKPRIGASGEDTFRLPRDRADPAWQQATDALRDRDVLVQPFQRSILTEGELSLIAIDGRTSHLMRKRPAGAEFRSQEEFGGEVTAATDPGFERWALDLLDRTPETRGLLFARVDGLRGEDGGWRLGELELIEPSLYFRTREGSARDFASALAARLTNRAHPAHATGDSP